MHRSSFTLVVFSDDDTDLESGVRLDVDHNELAEGAFDSFKQRSDCHVLTCYRRLSASTVDDLSKSMSQLQVRSGADTDTAPAAPLAVGNFTVRRIATGPRMFHPCFIPRLRKALDPRCVDCRIG